MFCRSPRSQYHVGVVTRSPALSPSDPGGAEPFPVVSSRLEIRRRLGCGTYGTVYLARDRVRDREVALKVFNPAVLGDAGSELFQREFRVLAGLRHPGIAQVFDFGYADVDERPYYTREFVTGQPLTASVLAPEATSPREYLAPILDVLDALDYLHGHGLLHLDVHGGNVLLERGGRARTMLIDLGVPPQLGSSAATPGLSSRSASGPSRLVVAPELSAGRPPTPAVDVYSVGRLLARLLEDAEHPYPGRLPREIPQWPARLLLELERIIAVATAPIPEARFSSVREFRGALARSLGASRSVREGRPLPVDRFVGRHDELLRVELALRAAEAGDVDFVDLTGPFGSGRTRLLDEARIRAQLRGLDVVFVSFLDEPIGGAKLARALRRVETSPSAGPSWAAMLDARRGESTAERSRRAAHAFLAAGPSVVLLLDDFDAADIESRALFEALVETSRQPDVARGLAAVVTTERGWSPQDSAAATVDSVSFSSLPPIQLAELAIAWLAPLDVSETLGRRLARASRGSPLRLERSVLELRERFADGGSVPDDVDLASSGGRLGESAPAGFGDGVDRAVLAALVVLERSEDADSVAHIADVSVARVRAAISKLGDAGFVRASRRGRKTCYRLVDTETRKRVYSGFSVRARRDLHRRAVERYVRLREEGDGGPHGCAELARHLLASGRRVEARTAAIDAARRFAAAGLPREAIALLGRVLGGEQGSRAKIELGEVVSDICSESGDHAEAVSILEPVFDAELARLSARRIVSWRRRLGVHHHRAGNVDSARRLFEEAVELADRRHDREELVIVRSEMAELHTLRGEYDDAERACRDGLELLRSSAADERNGPVSPQRRHLEVTLRASLGHLELRRFDLEAAHRELEGALVVAKDAPEPVRALILNNLAIVHHQRCDLGKAERFFARAEALFGRAGDRKTAVLVASNRALVAAKRGDASAAAAHLERAKSFGPSGSARVEFFAALADATVDYLFGRAGAAIRELPRAIEEGRKLGDRYMVGFASVYLAESHIAAGNYRRARELLVQQVRGDVANLPATLSRMALSRLAFVETVLGRTKAARRARRRLDAIPRGPIELPELWNDLIVGWLDRDERRLEVVERRFLAIGVTAGARWCLVATLALRLNSGDPSRARAVAGRLRDRARVEHDFLAVLEPIVLAEWYYAAGQTDAAEEEARRAGAAIISRPFLELDGCIESLHARVAHSRGNRDAARHHLHRAVQTRDAIARSLPERWRTSFLAESRFETLQRLRVRLRATVVSSSTPATSRRGDRAIESGAARDRRAGERWGFVGRSDAMVELYRTIDAVRGSDVPVIVWGESGTGKELVARAIGGSSDRREGRFLSIHCASVPEHLFEAELFGHEAGAFTDAVERRDGWFVEADGGTLFLDDVTQLPTSAQASLARCIDQGTVRAIGSSEVRRVDVRIIASANVSPDEMLERGLLRPELVYRLRGVDVPVPPLRAREGDAGILFEHFVALHAAGIGVESLPIDARVSERLERHGWPGNVREIESLAIRAAIASREAPEISLACVERLLGAVPLVTDGARFEGRTLDELRLELERDYLSWLFRRTRGDLAAMREELGIGRSRLYGWLRRLDLDVAALRAELEDSR